MSFFHCCPGLYFLCSLAWLFTLFNLTQNFKICIPSLSRVFCIFVLKIVIHEIPFNNLSLDWVQLLSLFLNYKWLPGAPNLDAKAMEFFVFHQQPASPFTFFFLELSTLAVSSKCKECCSLAWAVRAKLAVWFGHVVLHNTTSRPTKWEAVGLQTSYSKDVWCNHSSRAETVPMSGPNTTQQSSFLFLSSLLKVYWLFQAWDWLLYSLELGYLTFTILVIIFF